MNEFDQAYLVPDGTDLQGIKDALEAVSYTHLDVYKRQPRGWGRHLALLRHLRPPGRPTRHAVSVNHSHHPHHPSCLSHPTPPVQPEKEVPTMTNRALCVGINQFSNLPMASWLNGCVNDANDMAAMLRKREMCIRDRS